MHLKRLAASKHYPIKRKEYKFTVAPIAGPHAKDSCLPLQIIIRDVLGLAESASEVKKILSNKDVLVDGRAKAEPKYPVGLMDVISIPKLDKHYRIIPKKGKLVVVEIPKENSGKKLCKIINKTTIKKGLTQLNLHDGRNMLIEAKAAAEEKYSVGDTVVISVPEQKITKHLRLEKGNLALITNGKHEGAVGEIKDVIVTENIQKNMAVISGKDKDIETVKDYLFVVGKESAEIALE